MARRRTARQIAAARRNIVKAQRASAESRRGKSRSKKTGHHYGKGKVGRRQSRINTYGKKRHGLSIAQQTRRKQRANKWKRRAGVVASTAATGAALYAGLSPGQKAQFKQKTRDYGENVRIYTKGSKMVYKVNRQMGHSRRKSAAGAVPRRRKNRRS